MVEEKIVTIVKLKDLMTGKLKRVTKTVQNFSQTMQKSTTTVRNMTKKGLVPVTRTITKTNRAFGQFKFELLGILFFGMAVTRLMTGLIKPALEVTNAFTYS